MKLGEHKIKKTCRTNNKTCLKCYLKFALFKTASLARAHKKSLQKTLVLFFEWNRVLTVNGKLWCNASNKIWG